MTLVIEETAFKAVLLLDILKIAPVGLYGDNPMFCSLHRLQCRKSVDFTLYLCIQHAILNISYFCNSNFVTLDKLLNLYRSLILFCKMRAVKQDDPDRSPK